MSEFPKNLEHHRIAANIAEAKVITDPLPNNLGALTISNVVEGEFVPLATSHAIEADYRNIEQLQTDLIGEFVDFKDALWGDPNKSELKDAIAEASEKDKPVFEAALFAAHVARDFFSSENADKATRDNFGWERVDPDRDDTYNIKKLSETSDDGVCAEYSMLTQEVMQRLGHDASYSVIYRQQWADEPGEYHAVVTLEDSDIIVDSYMLAETLSIQKPMGILKAQEGTSVFKDRKNTQTYSDIFGRKGTYSASPIEAISI